MMYLTARITSRRTCIALSSLGLVVVGLGAGAVRTDAQTRAFVANTNGTQVKVIDLATGSTIPIDVGGATSQIVFSPDGTRAYASITGLPSIAVIEGDQVSTITLESPASGIAVSPKDGQLYVLNTAGGLESFSQQGTARARTFVVGVTDGKIAVTPDGNHVYIAA